MKRSNQSFFGSRKGPSRRGRDRQMRRQLCAENLESRTLMACDVTTLTAIDASYVDDGFPEFVAGDANLDGSFDQLDILDVLQAGKYLNDQPADWSEGDWNCDARFDHNDIIEALKGDNYVNSAVDETANPVANQYGQWFSETVTVDLRGTPAADDVGAYFPITIQATGHATHLGEFSMEGMGGFYVAVFGEAEGHRAVRSSGTSVASNGDELSWEFRVDDFSLGLGTGIGTFTGGTGRFADASGDFAFEEWNDVEESKDGILTINRTGEIHGTLTY